MKTRQHLELPANAPETYEELARLYVPRKIHDKVSAQSATELVDWLAVRAHSADQIEFLDLVSDLLDQYESQFVKNDGPTDPVELLCYLVEENGISARELGKILGVDRSVASRILKGERTITLAHAKTLGARFKVDPQLFLRLRDD
jgi:HTH-type transcriptional regulator / antitoxin HigA